MSICLNFSCVNLHKIQKFTCESKVNQTKPIPNLICPNPQMEFPPTSWSIRDQGLFETAVVRTTNGLSMEVLAKVIDPKPYIT